MSERYLEIVRGSSCSGNYIPSGRQLPRTPPLTDVKRHLDFCDVSSEDYENIEAGTRAQDNNDQNGTFDFSTLEAKTEHIYESDDPNSMLKGMKGYQLTPGDLEFIEKMKREKLIKKLQRDLEEVQRLLKKEMMAAELVCASREKAQAELKKFPSCEELTEWVKVVLQRTSPSIDLTDLNTKSLLVTVTKENIQKVMDEKRTELAHMEKKLENKRKKEAKEREQLEKQIATEQLKIQGFMSQLSDLKSELAQQKEVYKALEMQLNIQEAPEIIVEKEKVDTSEELQATKSQVKRQGKERKKAVKSTERFQDTTNQSKSSRSKLTNGKTDNQASVKGESLKTKQKSGAATEKVTKSARAAKGSQKKVEEKESDPQESERDVRGRRKPPGTAQTSASQLKHQSKGKTVEAPSRSRQRAEMAASEAVEEAHNAGLRRSKRLASRR